MVGIRRRRPDRDRVHRRCLRFFLLPSECHGQSLEGFEPIHAPPLSVANANSIGALSKLMHDGVPLGNREPKLMGPTSRARFSNFTPEAVAAVHAHLQSRS